MTVLNTTEQINYDGDGVTGVFSFPFPVKTASQVVAKRINKTTRETVETYVQGSGANQFQVTINTSSEGGSIALGATAIAALTSSFEIQINRVTPGTQQTKIPPVTRLDEKKIEEAFDRLAMRSIEQEAGLNSAIRLADTVLGVDGLITQAPVAGAAIILNDDADGFIFGPTADEISGAAASAAAAAASASAAATSATNAASSASSASTSASTATTQASAASTSASNAATSASTATTQASAAATSATNASTSATNAAASASTATTQASNASTSASNAATSATNASNSASAAATSASDAAASYDAFDDRYLGSKAANPTLDNDGQALLTGALYWNTVSNEMRVYNGSSWIAAYLPASSYVLKAGDSLTGALNFAKGADIASATTTDIGAATGNFVHITGTTTITGLGTVQAGTVRICRFAGALTLTHNATSLILPGAANITTAANDVAVFVSEGSGNWRCVSYTRANGRPVVATFTEPQYTSAEQTVTAASLITLTHGLGRKPKAVLMKLICKTAEIGYSIGDEVIVADMSSNGSVSLGLAAYLDNSTQINVRIASGGAVVTHKTTGVTTIITAANWRLIVLAYA